MITKQAIEERKARLQEDVEVTLQRLYMLNGALQDCDYWLNYEETNTSGTDRPQD